MKNYEKTCKRVIGISVALSAALFLVTASPAQAAPSSPIQEQIVNIVAAATKNSSGNSSNAHSSKNSNKGSDANSGKAIPAAVKAVADTVKAVAPVVPAVTADTDKIADTVSDIVKNNVPVRNDDDKKDDNSGTGKGNDDKDNTPAKNDDRNSRPFWPEEVKKPVTVYDSVPKATVAAATVKAARAPAYDDDMMYSMMQSIIPIDPYIENGFRPVTTYILYGLSALIAIAGALLVLQRPRFLSKPLISLLSFT